MIVDTVPVGGSYDSAVVAGRIGPETVAEPAPETSTTTAAVEAATDTPADQPAEATTAIADSATPEADAVVESIEDAQLKEERFWAQITLLGELSKAESNRQEAEELLEDAEERETNLKSMLEEVRNQIPELRTGVEEARTAVLAVSRDIHALIRDKKLPTRSSPATGVADADTPAAAEEPAVDPDAWRKLPTAELLKGVPRLGATKLAMIIEVAPTVGDLEDLRRKASEQHKSFKELLPKGCGQGVADAFEDRLVTHIAKFAKQAAGTIGKPATGLADDLVTSLRAEAVEQAWRPADCELDEHDTDMMRQGAAAYREGKPYTALPTLDPQLAHQWMVGWVGAEMIAAHATSDQSKASKQPEAN